MDGVQFADGFDSADRLAFGLGAKQLLAVVGSGVLGFLILHAPVPQAVAVPLALLTMATGSILGWVRLAGRPALDWALFAARYATSPRQGILAVQAPRPASVIPLRPAPAAAHPTSARAPGLVPVQRRDRSGAHRVVFFSLKGGTGRTTLATEVATALAGESPRGAHVVLVDLDVRSASVGPRLGLCQRGIVEYAVADPDARDVDDFTVRQPTGLRVLLGPTTSASSDWPVTPPVVREVLRELDMGGADVVVIDVSPEWNALTRAALLAADDVIVVIQPTATGIQDAYRTTAALRQLGLRHRLRYIVNRERRGTDVGVVVRDLGGELLGAIPDDPAIVDAEDSHVPVVVGGGGAAAMELRRLARKTLPVRAALEMR